MNSCQRLELARVRYRVVSDELARRRRCRFTKWSLRRAENALGRCLDELWSAQCDLIKYRTEMDRPLTAEEVDNNFAALERRLERAGL